MALLFFQRFEQIDHDATHDFSAGDTTATAASLAVISTDAAIIGTNGLDCPTSGDHFDWTITADDIIHRDQGCMGVLFRFATFSDTNIILNARGTSANDNIQLSMTGTDELSMRHRVNGVTNLTLDTTAANIATNTPYFSVIRWRDSDNARAIEVYNGTTGALIDSSTNSASAFGQQTDLITLRCGALNTVDAHLKNFFVADTYDEPIQDFFDITSYTQYGVVGGLSIPIAAYHYNRMRLN